MDIPYDYIALLGNSFWIHLCWLISHAWRCNTKAWHCNKKIAALIDTVADYDSFPIDAYNQYVEFADSPKAVAINGKVTDGMTG